MARWRLTQAHYLNVPGTEWEYKETDRTSGKQGRKVFAVPLYLPEDAVVAYAGSEQRGDEVFLGEPTPDMEPLDAEAQKISDACRPKWQHPIEALPGNFGGSLIANFEKQIAAAIAGQATPIANPVSAKGVAQSEFDALREQVAALMAQNEELKMAQAKSGRRV